ncbi:hypothetical protein D3C85_858950 [compost metagenome]
MLPGQPRAQVEGVAQRVAQEALVLVAGLLLVVPLLRAVAVIVLVEGHVRRQVERQLFADAGDVAGLQGQFPAVLAEVERLVVVVATDGNEQVGGDGEEAPPLRLVEQPHRHGQDRVGQAAAVAQRVAVVAAVEAAERQEDLRCDAVAAEVGVVHHAQDADLRVQPRRAGQAVAVAVQVVALGLLQVEQAEGGAGGGRHVVAGIQIQRVDRPAAGQAGAEQQQAPQDDPQVRVEARGTA